MAHGAESREQGEGSGGGRDAGLEDRRHQASGFRRTVEPQLRIREAVVRRFKRTRPAAGRLFKKRSERFEIQQEP